MKTYIVNLPRCPDRRENILRECARFELEPEIFGVDGQNLTETELQGLIFDPDNNQLSKSEIGCALSHCGIYGDMIAKDIPVALILEDDSVFSQDPRPLLAELERQPADSPAVYLLTHRANRYIAGLGPRQVGDMLFHRGWAGIGTHGYVITRKAAANIRGFQAPVKCPADWWKLFQVNDLIRLYICEKEIIGLHPELGQAAASLLENDRGATWGRARKRYVRRVRNQTPFSLRAKYFLFRLRHQFNIRCQ